MSESLIFSVITGAFVGLSAGYLGSLMLLKKMALIGHALSHVALPGLALAIVFSFNPFLGAFAFIFAASIITWYLKRSTSLAAEAIIGVLVVFALAIGILITPETELLEALFGDISNISMLDALLASAISVFAILVVRKIYQKVVLSLVSEELAVSLRINPSHVELVYLLLVSLVIAVGIKFAGSLLVGALVILPAAAARNGAANLTRYAIMSSIFGMASSVLGIVISASIGGTIPAGPLVVIVGAVFFLGSWIVNIKMQTKLNVVKATSNIKDRSF